MQNYNIFEYIKENVNILDVAKLFPNFYKTLEKAGHDYGTQCPAGHASKSGKSFKLISDGNTKDFYYCHSCGISGGAFNLAQLLLKADTKTTIQWFVEKFNLEPGYLHLNKEKTPEEENVEKKLIINSILYDKLIEYGKDLLFAPAGKDALDYLVNMRKYHPDNIKNTEFFYLPPVPEALAYLHKQFPNLTEAIKNLQLLGHFGDLFRLCIPYRNRFGKITGLLKRSTIPEGASGETWNGSPFTNQRWDSTKGLIKNDLFGLHKIKQGTDTVFLVEGYPDTMYIPTLGYENIVGLGQGRMSKDHLIGLKKKGIKHVVISLDNDGVGAANTEIAVRLLFSAEISVFVVPPGELGAYKDPDEFVIANGVKALTDVIDKAIEAEKWMIDWIYKDAITPLSKNKALTNAIEFASNVFNASGKTVYLEELAKKSGITRRILEKDIATKTKHDKLSKSGIIDKKTNNNITQNILSNLLKYDVIPFQETSSGDYIIYNRLTDRIVVLSSLDKMENMCANFGVALPEILPIVQLIFDTQSFDKISIEKKTMNLFTPSQFMIKLAKNSQVFVPETDFPNVWRLISNLVANSEPEVREYFINWLAYCFQTRNKSQISWVFKGKQGIGKNLFFEYLIKPFYGADVCQIVENSDLHSGFNGYLLNKLFIVFNEIAPSNNERYSVKSALKAIITDESISIEEKYQKRITVKNHINALFFSNESVPLILESDDRRYCVVKTGKPLKSFSWFNFRQFSKDLAKERDAFYQYLINYKVDFDKANTVIETKERTQMMTASMSQIESFAKALLNNDDVWLSSMQIKHLNTSSIFQGNAITVTPQDVNNQILRSLAFQLYRAIFPESKMTAKSLTDLLEGYGVFCERRMVNKVRDHYFFW